ncbi:pyridoxamine 5'-phosphate oxidase family protein [Rothia sp. AR01]|uniref:Pyridoxamine 5'-phosphate oxidase family protein n=1 Tax=Rothia santali TaxID=2949643 RepID=A0A9X2H906_9MICC|nr:pyridoxamine 5'-phosphate oxidase family protein [Rothia santali]MCP3425294.1 pyridoxamine 5'-phosphate oxidase family protein [Rothia santali]
MTTTTQEILDEIWRSLDAAVRGRTPFTLGYLGTVDAAGAPRVRAVILRRSDRGSGCLHVVSDRRAAKVGELAGDPRVAFTVWDEDRSVQLRVEGRALEVLDAEERARAWESLSPGSRDLYRSPLVPGTPLADDGAPAGSGAPTGTDGMPVVGSAEESATGSGAEREDDAAAFGRFAWIRIDCERLDWLDLSASPQARWEFERGGLGGRDERGGDDGGDQPGGLDGLGQRGGDDGRAGRGAEGEWTGRRVVP